MKFTLFTICVAILLLSSGCATKVTFISDPPGAYIRYRGEGRAAFRWKTAPNPAPTEINVYYGRISAYAIWPDGDINPQTRQLIPVETAHQKLSLSSTHKEEVMYFTMPEKAPGGN